MNDAAKEILTDLKSIINMIENIQAADLTESTKHLRTNMWVEELVRRSQQFQRCLIINPRKAC